MAFYGGFKSIGAPTIVAVSKTFAPALVKTPPIGPPIVVAPSSSGSTVSLGPPPSPGIVTSHPLIPPVPVMPLIPHATVSQLLSAPIPKSTASQTPVATVSQQPVTPMPQSLPAGAMVPSPPAGFPAYQIRPELIGAPAMKQTVIPGFFDPQTAASFAPHGLVQAVHQNPVIPPGAQPILPAAPVQPLFRNPAIRTANTAIASQSHAQAKSIIASTAMKKAAVATHAAITTASTASMNPTPAAQAAANAAALQAQQAQAASDAANQAAAQAAAQADSDAYTAQAAAQAQANAMTPSDPGFFDPSTMDSNGSDGADQGISPSPTIPPPAVDPSTLPVGTSLTYVPPSYTPAYAAGGGLALLGLMFAGPIGALVGAAIGGGGGYAYVKHKDDAQTAANMAPVAPMSRYGRYRAYRRY